ncbi:MAG: M20/M25/M40 family metallo-hydrolase [Clostridia bacterium]|nr:M20/M25/M40 family metallo-hydrolase [Clostridia bacterium]
MILTEKMEAYVVEHQEELKQLIRDLCAIPAPSHHEEKRAAFCKQWFEANGGKNVTIDEALNVSCPVGVTDDNEVVVFMGHTDTVFPDTEPMPFREDAEKFYCPGVVDDTANLSVMMICAKYFLENGIPGKTGILFVANSCEEGLGNLKGGRQLVKDYGKRMKAMISFDGVTLRRIVERVVGSHRYRVTVRTEGGHSYGKFGNRNAIFYLSQMITSFYAVKVPQKEGTKTTYNVGIISGGTSVNTIAQEAEMLFEYRSDDKECLAKMKNLFEKVIDSYRAMGIEVEVELVGDRPCGGEVDPEAFAELIAKAQANIKNILGEEPLFGSSSTDSNIPLAAGIPSITLTSACGQGCHTREEELYLSSLLPGTRLTLANIADYFEV